jgi:hypothetical protein
MQPHWFSHPLASSARAQSLTTRPPASRFLSPHPDRCEAGPAFPDQPHCASWIYCFGCCCVMLPRHAALLKPEIHDLVRRLLPATGGQLKRSAVTVGPSPLTIDAQRAGPWRARRRRFRRGDALGSSAEPRRSCTSNNAARASLPRAGRRATAPEPTANRTSVARADRRDRQQIRWRRACEGSDRSPSPAPTLLSPQQLTVPHPGLPGAGEGRAGLSERCSKTRLVARSRSSKLNRQPAATRTVLSPTLHRCRLRGAS